MNETTEGFIAVLREHRIECTGIGEVSCRCRENGWMTSTAYYAHVAERLAATLTSEGDPA